MSKEQVESLESGFQSLGIYFNPSLRASEVAPNDTVGSKSCVRIPGVAPSVDAAHVLMSSTVQPHGAKDAQG